MSTSRSMADLFVAQLLEPAPRSEHRLSWLKSISEQAMAEALGLSHAWIAQSDMHDALIAAGYRTRPTDSATGLEYLVRCKARVPDGAVAYALRTGTTRQPSDLATRARR